MFSKLGDPAGSTVTVFLDGVGVAAEPNETVAAVLTRQPLVYSRTTGISGAPRAPYCMMGVCFDCLAVVDGALVQTCLTPVRDGMDICRQHGHRKVTK